MDINEYVKQITEKSDSYEMTIQAIIAFDSAIRYDDAQKGYLQNSYCLPGRRLLKNANNPDDNVTPDIVIQLSNNYGIIAEVKLTANTDQDFKQADEQIEKYDTNLIGWKTDNEKIGLHDLSLLVNDFHKGKAKRYFESKTFQKKLTIIACARQYEFKVFFKIEKHHGAFSDTRLEKKFIDPIGIPLENPDIVKAISSVKFYDAEPPVEYMMNVLWMNILNEIAQREQQETEKMISVNCKELTKMLTERYSFGQIDSRQPKRPREDWVRQALDAFTKINYAYKDLQQNDKYLIKYSHPRKENMIVFFARKHYEALNKRKKKISEDKQLEFTKIAGK